MEEFFKALSCKWRIEIVKALKDGEKCQCEIAKILPIDPSTLSRHLSMLKSAGILEERREGREKRWRVKDERVFDIIELAEKMVCNAR